MNVFDIIPSDFFNCLAGKSNNRVYADCLELIHNQYDKEISYRLERSYLRDVLAAFLLENHLDLSDEEKIANARERMLRNKGLDFRGIVEQTLRIFISSENSSEKEELGNLFNIQKYAYVDQSSVMYPHKSQQILHNTESNYFELSKEEIERQKYILEQESHNPYSNDQMKKYMDDLFMQNEIIDNSQFNYSNKEYILKSLAAVSYAKEMGT